MRKGAAIFVVTGCTVSFLAASIFLRKNWTLGGVKDRYIKYDKARDQFVGRSISGLPILKNISQCPLLTLIFCHVKMITIRKEKNSS